MSQPSSPLTACQGLLQHQRKPRQASIMSVPHAHAMAEMQKALEPRKCRLGTRCAARAQPHNEYTSRLQNTSDSTVCL